MQRAALMAGAVIAASLLSAMAHAQGLSGDEINVNNYVDLGSYGYSEGSMTTADPGSGGVGGLFSYTLTPDTISVQVPHAGFANLPFNGLIFTDETQDPGILDVSLASNTGGPTPELSFTSDSVSLNFAGLVTGYPTQTLTYDLSFPAPETPVSAAPEPSVWLLMLAGVAMIGSALRLNHSRRTFAHLMGV